MAKKTSSARIVTVRGFKAKCSTFLEEVASTGRAIIITDRGKPVAQLCPVRPSICGMMKGRIEILGDIISPIDVRWNALDE